jgi:hypothetical protein
MGNTQIDDMIQTLRRETGMRKSLRLAKAVASDYEKCFGSKAEGCVGTTDRKPWDSTNPTPGVYIRAITYKAGTLWESFFRKEDAEEYSRQAAKSITTFWKRDTSVKNHSQDFGLIAAIEHLKREGSPLTSTLEVFNKLSLSHKYGI